MRMSRLLILVISPSLFVFGTVRSEDVWRPKPKRSFQYTVVMDSPVLTLGGVLEAADGDLGLCGDLLYQRSTRYCHKKGQTMSVKSCSHLCAGPLDRQLQDCKQKCPIYMLCMYGMKGQNDTLCQRFFDYRKPGISPAAVGSIGAMEVTTHATEPAVMENDSNTFLGFLDVPEECRSGMHRLFVIFIFVQFATFTVISVMCFLMAKWWLREKTGKGFMRSNLRQGSNLNWKNLEEFKENAIQNEYTIGDVTEACEDANYQCHKEEVKEKKGIEAGNGDLGLNDSKSSLDFTDEDYLIRGKKNDRVIDTVGEDAEVKQKLVL